MPQPSASATLPTILSPGRRRGRQWAGTAIALIAMAMAGRACAADAAEPAASQKPLPVALVDALNTLSHGPHAGYRANHAKGLVVSGSFAPTPAAAGLSKAAVFSQPKVPVTVRFSNPTGVPNLPDADPNASPHGMAIRFQPEGAPTADMVCISANGFPVATPQDFLALLQAVAASGPNAAKPTPIEQFLGSHPAAMAFVTTPRPAPKSFATLAFYGVNAFKFTNAKGESRYVRYQLIPAAGEQSLDADATKAAAPDYLMDELPKRIAGAPVAFKLWVQLAAEGDKTDDATAVWPASRERVELGTITLDRTAADQPAAQKALLFNPVALPEGWEPSADPILAARFPAYAVSFGQRAQ